MSCRLFLAALILSLALDQGACQNDPDDTALSTTSSSNTSILSWIPGYDLVSWIASLVYSSVTGLVDLASRLGTDVSDVIQGVQQDGLSYFIPSGQTIVTIIDYLSYPLQVLGQNIMDQFVDTSSELIRAVLAPQSNETSPLANATVNIVREAISGGWCLMQTSVLPFLDSAAKQLEDTGELSPLLAGPLESMQTAYHVMTMMKLLKNENDRCGTVDEETQQEQRNANSMFPWLPTGMFG